MRSANEGASAGRLLSVGSMDDSKHKHLIPLALLATTSGARTWAGIAAMSTRAPAKLAAGVELVYDKFPNVPRRIDRSLVAGRVAAGALVGASVGRRTGRSRAGSAVLGGLLAFAGAHVTYRMRRALGKRLSPVAAALVEDAFVVGAAMLGAALLDSDR
jgi:uncharacterized membrane protein